MLGAALLFAVHPQARAQDIGYFPQTTYKIVQLTGETDQPRRIPTLSRMWSNYCVHGTDLGSTFEHNGHLYFLFGDTPGIPGTHDDRDDFLAWTDATRPEDVALTVNKDGDCVHILTVPGVPLAGLEVPSYGISLTSGVYVVVTTDAFPADNPLYMGRSVMAVSHDDGYSFQQLYDLSVQSQGGQFINVSMVEVDGTNFPGLPPEKCVLIWGSGLYRLSDVRLAYIPSSQITDKSAIRYFSGLQGNAPQWSTNEVDATLLFTLSEPVVGELSVAFCAQLGQWIMLYNAGTEIHMRSASSPWGPWSFFPTTIFEGWRDRAYGRFMHWPGSDVFADSPLVGPDQGGGPYGPYLIPRFLQGDQNRVTIVYTMSTWNPYQALLMQSDIGHPDRVPPESISSEVTLPGGPGWTVSGDFLRQFVWTNGVPYVTTYANNGDADMGVAQYGFVASGCDQALEFSVQGGDAEVVLIEQSQDVPVSPPDLPAFYNALKNGAYGRVVETMIGPQTNGLDLSVRWDLRRHRGKLMRLFVIDALNRPWGFISVSQVTRYFVNGSVPSTIYVNRTNTAGPFLGTADHPFPTVTAGYNASASACSANLMIGGGNYPEALTMNKPMTVQAFGGPAIIGHQ